MNLYQVTFGNTGAMFAKQLSSSDCESVKIEEAEGRKILKWITVYANDENESFTIANKVAEGIFNFDLVA